VPRGGVSLRRAERDGGTVSWWRLGGVLPGRIRQRTDFGEHISGIGNVGVNARTNDAVQWRLIVLHGEIKTVY
jgi:hypothetical protein